MPHYKSVLVPVRFFLYNGIGVKGILTPTLLYKEDIILSNLTLTRKIADFVLENHLDQYQPLDLALLKTAIADWIAVTLSGAEEESVQMLVSVMKTQSENGSSALIGRSERTSSLWAALINGTASHSQDFDDVHDFLSMHSTVPVCSAAITAAEMVHASGAEFINAVANGMQLMAAIAAAIMPEHYQNMWHATATIGIFGSAAACGNLLHLTPEQLCHAFGIAASKASGIQTNFGSMTKPMQPAQASRNGLESVLLAREGFTANDNIFESNFFSMLSARVEPENILPRLKDYLSVHDLRYKRFPCGAPTHSAILNSFALVREYGFTAEDIDRIVLEPYPRAIRLAGTSHPNTGLAGKFSLPFCAAAAIVTGQITRETFSDEVLHMPAVQELLNKIELVPNESYNASRGGKATFCLKDGRVLTHEVHPLGKKADPEAQQKDVREKFMEIAPDVIGNKTEDVWNYLQELETGKDIHTLMSLLSNTNN